jgi:hypothetical protein
MNCNAKNFQHKISVTHIHFLPLFNISFLQTHTQVNFRIKQTMYQKWSQQRKMYKTRYVQNKIHWTPWTALRHFWPSEYAIYLQKIAVLSKLKTLISCTCNSFRKIFYSHIYLQNLFMKDLVDICREMYNHGSYLVNSGSLCTVCFSSAAAELRMKQMISCKTIFKS